MRRKIVLAWSSGKDSAMAGHRLKEDPSFELIGLFTTFRETDKKIPIHEVPLSAIREQAESLGLPLCEIPLPRQCPNAEYEERVLSALRPLQQNGISHLAFGDLFLEEIRDYREKQFHQSGFSLVFPLWGMNTKELALQIIRAGIRATITAVDETKLPQTFIGREFDESFLKSLPPGVDPCGENGEFHSFVTHSPNFQTPVSPPRRTASNS